MRNAEVSKAAAVLKSFCLFLFYFLLAALYFHSALQEKPFASQTGQDTFSTAFRLPWFFILNTILSKLQLY